MLNLLKYSKAFLSLTALFAVIALSTITVYALNPKAAASTTDPVASVLGATTTGQNINPLTIQVLPASRNMISLALTDTNKYEASLSFQKLESLSNTFDFLSIGNSNDISQNLFITTTIQGTVSNDLTVYLTDGINRILLFSPTLPNLRQEINFDANNVRNFKLEIDTDQPISFPFGLTFTLF